MTTSTKTAATAITTTTTATSAGHFSATIRSVTPVGYEIHVQVKTTTAHAAFPQETTVVKSLPALRGIREELLRLGVGAVGAVPRLGDRADAEYYVVDYFVQWLAASPKTAALPLVRRFFELPPPTAVEDVKKGVVAALSKGQSGKKLDLDEDVSSAASWNRIFLLFALVGPILYLNSPPPFTRLASTLTKLELIYPSFPLPEL